MNDYLKLKEEIYSGKRVCPEPGRWHWFYKHLCRLVPNRKGSIPEPIILGAYWNTNDYEKNQRLIEQIEFIEEEGIWNDAMKLLSNIADKNWVKSSIELNPSEKNVGQLLAEDHDKEQEILKSVNKEFKKILKLSPQKFNGEGFSDGMVEPLHMTLGMYQEFYPENRMIDEAILSKKRGVRYVNLSLEWEELSSTHSPEEINFHTSNRNRIQEEIALLKILRAYCEYSSFFNKCLLSFCEKIVFYYEENR